MATFHNRITDISKITGPSGWYIVSISEEKVPVYIDQEYDGGGWVCVLANRSFTAGMNNLTYNNAINKCNYRTNGSNDSTNTTVGFSKNFTELSNYNIWVGLKYWSALSGREVSNKITVVQYVAPSHGVELNDTSNHTKRYRWRFDNFATNNGYYFVNSVQVSDETNTGQPGFYSYHSKSSRKLTTFDSDQDSNSGNCSTYYNKNPWWYGSCWSGNYFAGGGYQDKSYWVSAGGDHHNYGAVYIK